MTNISNPVISTVNDVYNLIKENHQLSDKFSYSHPIKTKGRSILLSLGRIWINMVLPEDFRLINEEITKDKLNDLVIEIYNKYGPNVAADHISRLQSEAFKLSTVVPTSFTIDDFIPPKEWIKKKDEFLKKADQLNPIEFKKEAEKINMELVEHIKKSGSKLSNIFEFKPKGDPVSDWQILLLSKGYVQDIEGKLLGPITKSLNDGYGKIDYYHAAAEARRNFFFRSSLTAHPGYLTTKVVMANAATQIREHNCDTRKYFEINVTKELADLIHDRYHMENGKLKKIENSEDIIGKTIKLRSPLFCKTKDGLCEICYGDLHKKLNTKNVGILAGGAVNVVGINAMMKMRHKASSVTLKEVDFPKMIQKVGANLADFKNYLDIQKNKIIAKVPCTITLDENEYDDETFIDSGEKIQIPGMLSIQIDAEPEKILTLPITITVNLIKPTNYESNHRYILHFEPGETIIEQEYYSDDFDEKVMMRLFEGGAKYINTPENLVLTIHDRLPGIDLVHIELVVSNMFRDAEDISKPARLTDYKKFVIIGQKKLPFTTSWLNALAFENINRAIKVGLIEGKDAVLDPIEKIVLENYYKI